MSGPPLAPQIIDPAEVIALRTIVMVMLGLAAEQAERTGGPQAQRFINNLSEVASDAIETASFVDGAGQEAVGVKERAIGHVNSILAGVKFPKVKDTN